MKIKIDKEGCIGCGTCNALCPECFGMGDDFKAFVKEGADAGKPCVKDAVEACPVQVISIEE